MKKIMIIGTMGIASIISSCKKEQLVKFPAKATDAQSSPKTLETSTKQPIYDYQKAIMVKHSDY